MIKMILAEMSTLLYTEHVKTSLIKEYAVQLINAHLCKYPQHAQIDPRTTKTAYCTKTEASLEN